MQSVIIGSNQAGQRLDKFLHKYLPEAGTGFLYKMLRKKNITLNGKKAEGKEMLSKGDEVKFFFSDETFAKMKGKPMAVVENEYRKAFKRLQGISVLYEDEHALILNKPAGILTQKAENADLSLNEWMIGYLLEQESFTEEELESFKPSVCNRLDRNTSGIVLCGKSLAGSQALSRIIKDRSLQKFYHTICIGEMREGQRLKGYLSKNEAVNKVNILDRLPEDASCTSYQAIETAYRPLNAKNGYTLLEVELVTGKTHQIRSHLSHIGHPIIGDGKYGNPKQNRKFREDSGLSFQLLHAYRVVFPEGEEVLRALAGKEIIAPHPALFEKLEEMIFNK